MEVCIGMSALADALTRADRFMREGLRKRRAARRRADLAAAKRERDARRFAAWNEREAAQARCPYSD
jgi:hypothetical protein